METQGVDVDGEAIKKAIIRGGGRFKKFARGKIIVCTVGSKHSAAKSLDEVWKSCTGMQHFFYKVASQAGRVFAKTIPLYYKKCE